MFCSFKQGRWGCAGNSSGCWCLVGKDVRVLLIKSYASMFVRLAAEAAEFVTLLG